MSTNAMIYKKMQDNSVKGIYLHWDGYPSWAGDKLINHYTTEDKVQRLIELGAISVLGNNPEPCELVRRFGFNGTTYPHDDAKAKSDYLPKEWRDMSESERKRLSDDYYRYEGTVAYARDRGEEPEWDTYPSVAELKKTTANQAYEYYWDGEAWYMRQNKVFRKLYQNTCDRLQD